MARVRKPKELTIEGVVFATPEQRVLRFLLAHPTTAFTPRVLSSKLKGVRGLGGVDGIVRILKQLEELGFVEFQDNNRAIILHNDNGTVQALKKLSALCDLEGLRSLCQPFSSKGILFGSRATGQSRTDSDYDILVVSESPDDVTRTVTSHPMGKRIELVVCSREHFLHLDEREPDLATKLTRGIVIWGAG